MARHTCTHMEMINIADKHVQPSERDWLPFVLLLFTCRPMGAQGPKSKGFAATPLAIGCDSCLERPSQKYPHRSVLPDPSLIKPNSSCLETREAGKWDWAWLPSNTAEMPPLSWTAKEAGLGFILKTTLCKTLGNFRHQITLKICIF